MSNGAKTVEHIAHKHHPSIQLPQGKGVIEENGDSQTAGYLFPGQDEQGMSFKVRLLCLKFVYINTKQKNR